MGNKKAEMSTVIGKLNSIMCDNQGNKELKIKFKNVAVIPTCAFKPIQHHKACEEWMETCRRQDYINLTQKRIKSKFDVVINTLDRMLLAGYLKWVVTQE